MKVQITNPGGELVEVGRRGDVSDRAFRVYALTSEAFGDREFTADQAAEATRLNLRQVGLALGELRKAGIYTRRKRVVGYTGSGARIWRVVYRKVKEVEPA